MSSDDWVTSFFCSALLGQQLQVLKMGKKSEPKHKKGDSKKDSREQDRGGKDRKDDNKFDKKWKDQSKRNKGKSYRSYDTREEIELAKTLAESNLVIHRMDGDGNCMFRSIADQLTGDPEHHEMFREKIMKYISQHADHFSLFMEDDENFDVYVERMNQLNEWGGHPELYAASQCFHINITVYQLDNPTYIIQAGASDNKLPKDIRLSYHGECHYNSVRSGTNTANTDSSTVDLTISAKTASTKEQTYVFDDDLALVQSAVPWIDKDKVIAVLQQCKGDVDVAIERLCADAEGVTLEDNSTPKEPIDSQRNTNTTNDTSIQSDNKDDSVPDLTVGTCLAKPVLGKHATTAAETTASLYSTNEQDNKTSTLVATETVCKDKKYRKNGDAKGKPLSKKVRNV